MFFEKIFITYMEGVSYDLGFIDSNTVIADGITQVYNYIHLYLVFLLFFLSIIGITILLRSYFFIKFLFNIKKFSISKYKYLYNFSIVKFTHNVIIEFVWTLIPGLILTIIALPSFILLYSMDEIIEPSMTLKIIGHQWYWEYEYNLYDYLYNEKINESFESWIVQSDELEIGDLRLLETNACPILPNKTHIRAIITSSDVLHAWALPAAGIKIDAVPGRLNQGLLYFYTLGINYGQCSELCGLNHAFMPIKVVITSDFINYSN